MLYILNVNNFLHNLEYFFGCYVGITNIEDIFDTKITLQDNAEGCTSRYFRPSLNEIGGFIIMP
jgi:hypothetical protein